MDTSFSPVTAKRSIYTVDPLSPNSAAVNGSHKRSKLPLPPLKVPEGHFLFRILCNSAHIGGVIGKSGNSIKQLQQETSAKIRVEDSPPGTDDRVIVIIASTTLKKEISLYSSSSGAKNSDNTEKIEVSAAQMAVIRVFQTIMQVVTDTEAVETAPGSVVTCRLLTEANQAGSVIGKGGKVIENIRKDTGVKIRVVSGDKLPMCAGENDEMVLIEGGVSSIERALVTVAERLQECPTPSDVPRMHGSRHVEDMSDLHQDSFSHRSLYRTPGLTNSYNYAPGNRSLPFDSGRAANLDPKTERHEVIFKILCANEKVGSIIGKGGFIVKYIQKETGANISVGSSITGCDERLITITGSEDPDSRYSPAQSAVIIVFNRYVEAGFENGPDSGSERVPTVTARLVIPTNQVGCLLGKGGAIISDMRRETGTSIRIITGDQVPKAVAESDGIVQISGELVNVQDALGMITSRLRENVLCGGIGINTPVETGLWSSGTSFGYSDAGFHSRTGYPPADPTPEHSSYPGVPPSLNYSHHTCLTSPPLLRPTKSGAEYGRLPAPLIGGPFKGSVELGSGNRTAIVTNTTVEIMVPEHVIGSVYGENGKNLSRLRQISGANVVVHEPQPGTGDRVVIISGTPEESHAAQSLLQAFILTGSS